MKNKKKKQMMVVSSLMMLGLLAGIFFVSKQQPAKRVKADTSDSVTLDSSDENYKYVVSADATGQGGLDLPTGAGWFQNDALLPSLSKNVINTYTSDVDDGAVYIGTLSDGSIMFQNGSRSEAVSDFPTDTFVFRSVMVKTDSEGKRISQAYIATGQPTHTPNINNTTTALESARDTALLSVEANDQIIGKYYGTRPGVPADQHYIYQFNGATMSGFDWEKFTMPNSINYVISDIRPIPNQNDGKLYVTRGGTVVPTTQAATRNSFELYEYNSGAKSIDESGILLQLNTYHEMTGVTPTVDVQISFTDLRRYGNHYILLVRYGSYIERVPAVQYIYKLDASNGNQISRMQVSDRSETAKSGNLIKGVSDADPSSYYYMDYSNNRARLMKLDPAAFTSTLVKEFPSGTTVQDITKYTNGNGEDEYNIYMTVDTQAAADPMFSGYLNNSGIAFGILDKDFELKNLRGLSATGSLGLNSFEPIPNTDNYAIAGSATINSDFITGPFSKRAGAGLAAFYGTLTLEKDYSPGIKFTKDNILIDLDDPDEDIENKLLDGIDVTDTYDFSPNNISGQKNEAWLKARINRNPRRINYAAPIGQQFPAIDWKTLGFDKTKTGPQKVKYFVSDGSMQSSSISRWINKIGTETIIDDDDKYALDAQNFHVPLENIATTIPDANKFKEYAKTMAWSLTKHGISDGDQGGGLDEDGKDSSKLSGKVTVNATQLKALREATTAKPYPVDVTYKPESGIEITNRVWVFVTTKNTLPNSAVNPEVTPVDTNGVVYYADDYTLPYRLRTTQTNDEVLKNGNIKVYDYFDASHETAAELPTLADATKNANKLVVDLPPLHNALAPGKVTPSVTYKWDGPVDSHHKDGSIAGNETVGYLDVNLTGNILFHIRQVVLNESNEIVVPTESYIDVHMILNNNGSPIVDPDYQANLTGKSEVLANKPAFTDFTVGIDQLTDLSDQVQLSVVVPEFYNYLGYYQTTQQTDANGQSHENNTSYTAGWLQINRNVLLQDEEFWVSMYIQPNVDGQDNPTTPQPYSWDYKKNDLGKIKTK
ncbi:hypothetical protein [Candidatus Enterococcus ferrettii]|uniref:Uncharacterized protein n=1 Tax=Candidatus Enterococcus ferrettii TaxID=2815324 RepID=A0ABV0EMU5_9ENTE|nr:hypothetical protein [Enterococcus sp. 665A]MBO1342427.1 hypothetical protein [Enterococcus sp. 665A]